MYLLQTAAYIIKLYMYKYYEIIAFCYLDVNESIMLTGGNARARIRDRRQQVISTIENINY